MKVTRSIGISVYNEGKIVEIEVDDERAFLPIGKALDFISQLIRSQERPASLFRAIETDAVNTVTILDKEKVVHAVESQSQSKPIPKERKRRTKRTIAKEIANG